MYVMISQSQAISLEDVDDFKSFSIVTSIPLENWPETIRSIASATDNSRYWLNADSIVTLSGRSDDASWVESFWAMLASAEPFGYADTKGRRLKSHVEYINEVG